MTVLSVSFGREPEPAVPLTFRIAVDDEFGHGGWEIKEGDSPAYSKAHLCSSGGLILSFIVRKPKEPKRVSKEV